MIGFLNSIYARYRHFLFPTAASKKGSATMDKQDLKKFLAGLSVAGLLGMGGVSGCTSAGSG
jgi:radical SAM modification target selenobiotic family peptide